MDKTLLKKIAGQIIDLQNKLKQNPKDFSARKQIQAILSQMSVAQVLQVNDIVEEYFNNI